MRRGTQMHTGLDELETHQWGRAAWCGSCSCCVVVLGSQRHRAQHAHHLAAVSHGAESRRSAPGQCSTVGGSSFARGVSPRCGRPRALWHAPDAAAQLLRSSSSSTTTQLFPASFCHRRPTVTSSIDSSQQGMPPKTHFCCSCWIYWPSSRLTENQESSG